MKLLHAALCMHVCANASGRSHKSVTSIPSDRSHASKASVMEPVLPGAGQAAVPAADTKERACQACLTRNSWLVQDIVV